jgi:putative spermidine/putrescine transport system permease protein
MSVSSRNRMPWLGGMLLLAPALMLLLGLFGVPAIWSVAGALTGADGRFSLEHPRMAFDVYGWDVLFTAWLVCLSVMTVALVSIAIAGYLTLGGNRTAVRILGWLYRWPLFVPMICAAQMMRSFLAKNGMLNNTLIAMHVMTPLQASSFLDWRGILVTFTWKQVPFVTLMLAGAMASLDRGMIEAARNLGASRVRVLAGIVLPLVRAPLLVACILTFVTLMSVLSVPVMLTADTPTMITVDMAYRINTFHDYGTADALGLISYIMSIGVAWIYLRHSTRERGLP